MLINFDDEDWVTPCDEGYDYSYNETLDLLDKYSSFPDVRKTVLAVILQAYYTIPYGPDFADFSLKRDGGSYICDYYEDGERNGLFLLCNALAFICSLKKASFLLLPCQLLALFNLDSPLLLRISQLQFKIKSKLKLL